ncbi:unnamed protein product [Ectocarpus sp. CCAP 1310/34]|nr:unnamed protein product [Ectocarpus sp. CCAP 1310/34]
MATNKQRFSLHDFRLSAGHADARDLYVKIKDSLDKEQWNPEDNEEYEDGEGNVLNRRTYEGLARQGLM